MIRAIEKPKVVMSPLPPEELPEPESEPRNLPPGPLAIALRAPLRHWWWSLTAAAVSAVLALAVGMLLSSKTWKAEGVLVYTQIPLPEPRKASYSPQKLETLIAIIKSTSDLETLRQEFDLPMTVEALGKKIKVEQEPRSEKVSVVLEWGDRDTGADIVNRLMELHIQHVASIQKGKTAEMVVNLQSQLKELLTQRDLARTELATFQSKEDIVDIRKDRERLEKEVAEAEKDMADTTEKASSYPQEVRVLDEQIARLNNDLSDKSLEDLARAAEEDRDYRKHRKELEDSAREEERHRAEAEKEYRDADQEARTAESLIRSGAISLSEAEKLRGKADLFKLKMANSEKKRKGLEEDLRQLPRDHFLGKAADLRKHKNELKEEERALRSKIARLEEYLKALRDRKEKRLVVLSEGEVLEKKYKELDARRLQCEEQLADLRGLGSEVKIDTPAKPQRDAFASDFKKIAAIAFALPLLLFFGGMVLFDAAANAGTPRTLARRLGLPVLGRFPAAGKAVLPAESRALALRVRNSVSEPGGILLFAPLSGNEGVNELVSDVCRYLALQDEKVLIVDGRIGDCEEKMPPPWISPLATAGGCQATGLVQYLVFEGQSIWKSILPTRFPGVEYLPAGGPCSTTDVLASQQMRELLDTLRRHYSLIVMTAPATDHPIDTEILSNYSDGVLAVVSGSGASRSPAAQDLVRALREGGAPLLGAVLCE